MLAPKTEGYGYKTGFDIKIFILVSLENCLNTMLCMILQKTGSNPADINRFRSYTGISQNFQKFEHCWFVQSNQDLTKIPKDFNSTEIKLLVLSMRAENKRHLYLLRESKSEISEQE